MSTEVGPSSPDQRAQDVESLPGLTSPWKTAVRANPAWRSRSAISSAGVLPRGVDDCGPREMVQCLDHALDPLLVRDRRGEQVAQFGAQERRADEQRVARSGEKLVVQPQALLRQRRRQQRDAGRCDLLRPGDVPQFGDQGGDELELRAGNSIPRSEPGAPRRSRSGSVRRGRRGWRSDWARLVTRASGEVNRTFWDPSRRRSLIASFSSAGRSP